LNAEAKVLQCEYICVHEDIVQQVTAALPDEDTLIDLSDLFKLFGDSTRLKILSCLSVHEMCVCDIATMLQMTQSAISHQLAVLKRSKLISARREGKTVFYALADEHVRGIIRLGTDHVTE